MRLRFVLSVNYSLTEQKAFPEIGEGGTDR